MKKIIALALAAAMALPGVSAQDNSEIKVQSWEGGLQIFMPIGVGGNYDYESKKPGIGGQIELRYNVPQTKFDVGAFLQIGAHYRDYWSTLEHFRYDADLDDYILVGTYDYKASDSFTNITFGVTSHYNFLQGRKVNPFAGLGVGVSAHVGPDEYAISEGASFSVMPEVGVELFRHLRLSARYLVTKRSFNQFQISVGITFGGRLKK